MVERDNGTRQHELIVGVLMLDTGFERLPRDIGCASSLPFRSMQRVVPQAVVASVVNRRAMSIASREAFVAAGQDLVDAGAALITTSCGFLHREQAHLAQSLPVPVIASALLALPMLQAIHGAHGPVGVLSFDAAALGPIELAGGSCVIEGIAAKAHFRDVIEERVATADHARLEADVGDAADRLARHRPSVVVLECTNLAPWRCAIADIVGVPVIDLVDVIGWTLDSMSRQRR